jgi:tight adherence protein B
MKSLLASDFVMIFLTSVCFAVIFYMYYDRGFNFLKKKSLGQKEEIMRLLDLMFVEIDEKRVTVFMLLLSFGLGTLVFFLLLPKIIPGLVVGVIVTVVGWSAPLWIVKAMYEKRCSKLVDQMVDGLTIMANGVKSGLSVPQTMERVVENMPNPISQEFDLVLSQIRLGRNLEQSLIEFGERIPRPDVQMFVTAINILKETGGNLAETFQTIVLVIRERQKIEKKIEAMTAQGKTQAMIISMAPFALLGLFAVTQPDYIAPLFNTTLGLFLFIGMVGLIIIGSLVMRKVVTINV